MSPFPTDQDFTIISKRSNVIFNGTYTNLYHNLNVDADAWNPPWKCAGEASYINTLTKDGMGTLVLAADNRYIQHVHLHEGALHLGSDKSWAGPYSLWAITISVTRSFPFRRIRKTWS